MSHADVERLRAIKTFPSLVKYLRDELDWPIETDDVEELTFEYDPEELGIDLKTAAKIQEIKQLRPLSRRQPWGIFFVKFEPKRLPVVVLRRILSQLVVKKRASISKAKQAVWHLHDLLFISNYGEGSDRQITFAHFTESAKGDDLPTLRVLGWDDQETLLHMEYAARTLRNNFRWPGNEADPDAWRDSWSAAFAYRHREAINTAKDLADRLAILAMRIRSRVNQAMAVETEKGPIRKLFMGFQQALIHDLTEAEFADMYAQTITYGLLAARVSRPMGIIADNLHELIPVTNPFLKEMLESFMKVGGRTKGGLDFDELGVQEVVEVLNDPETHIEAVLREFNNKDRQEDPVIHFYEDFLSAYDKAQKKQRGVFYTPQPVVSYIVRSVHELLQTEFGMEDGLASTTTWSEMAQWNKDLKIPDSTDPKSPFVQILDPATGTGTFLVEVIDVIHQTLKGMWTRQRLTDAQQQAAWNDYVPKHLLPRLHGYELMMAPYAIAHLKIGLKLYETGYRFACPERARIYLTNALEPPSDEGKTRLEGILPALAHEAAAVNEVKRHKRFTVIIGNPPYSGVSANNSETAVRLVDPYKFVDGVPLGERKHWLQDDYKKFVRIAQIKIETAGAGIVGYITNHGFLDDPTARGMRRSLMSSFSTLHILDAHGSLKKREVCPNGTIDQNVFDIEPGVSIGLFQRAISTCPESVVNHSHLWGLETVKSRFLSCHQLSTTDWSVLDPKPRFYLFTPSDSSLAAEYELGVKLSDVFSVSSVGCVTARDGLTIHWDAELAWQTVKDFASLPVEMARTKYGLGKDVRDWTVEGAQKDVRKSGPSKSLVAPIHYRPFDQRFTYYTGQSRGFIGQPQPKVMRQFLMGPNLGLCIGRQGQAADTDEWSVVFCSKFFTDFNLFRRGGNNLNPLYTYQSDHDGQGQLIYTPGRTPNLSPSFLHLLAHTLGVTQSGEYGLPRGLSPEDIFQYTYALFHSPSYRRRYAEFLKIDFPRLPLTGNLSLFCSLAKLGGELVAFHLLESINLDHLITTYIGPRNPKAERIGWSNSTVWLDASATQKGQDSNPGTIGFKGVPEDVWNFHVGGYQVCEKWLKDRKGRTLSEEDIVHYQKIVVAISETIRLMAEIDKAIDAHGGWPGAFQEKS